MVDENKWLQYGFPREGLVQGLIIYELKDANKNSEEVLDYLNNFNKTVDGCYHYIVDSTHFLQLMPEEYSVLSTGKGRDWASENTISVCLCDYGNSDKLDRTVDIAVNLIKEIQNRYHFPYNEIYFLNDFYQREYNPKHLIDIYGSSRAFVIERIQEE